MTKHRSSQDSPAFSHPTPFADLNAVLANLVGGAHDALLDKFVGAYLQGSFALGEADEHSDVDFLVVTNTEVTRDPNLETYERRLRLVREPLTAEIDTQT